MLIVKHKKFILTIANVYYADANYINIPEADIVFYRQSSLYRKGSKEFKTLHSNLLQDKKTFLSNMNSTTRYEIKRAETKDNLKYYITNNPASEEIDSFVQFYTVFAQSKGLAYSERNKMKINLTMFLNAKSLYISFIKQETPLCYHVYLCDDKRVRLLMSASHHLNIQDSIRRALIGRGNRYLHWMDIKYFKEAGFFVYDWGGLGDESDPVLKRINDFKRGFGGNEVIEYHSVEGITILGKLAVMYLKKRDKV